MAPYWEEVTSSWSTGAQAEETAARKSVRTTAISLGVLLGSVGVQDSAVRLAHQNGRVAAFAIIATRGEVYLPGVVLVGDGHVVIPRSYSKIKYPFAI